MIDTNDPDVQEMIARKRRLKAVLSRVSGERHEQDKQWGGPIHDNSHSAFDWIALITKQLGKAAGENMNPEKYHDHMIKVAALAVAACEWAERWDELLRQSEAPKGEEG